MNDYENDLAFKPAMSWDELCEYAESKGRYINFGDGFRVGFGYAGSLTFFRDGKVKDGAGYLLQINVYYERMKTIIEALWGE